MYLSIYRFYLSIILYYSLFISLMYLLFIYCYIYLGIIIWLFIIIYLLFLSFVFLYFFVLYLFLFFLPLKLHHFTSQIDSWIIGCNHCKLNVAHCYLRCLLLHTMYWFHMLILIAWSRVVHHSEFKFLYLSSVWIQDMQHCILN